MIAEPVEPPSSETDEIVDLSIPLSADIMAALRVAAFQRRSLGDQNVALPSLICEAICQWLEREMDNTTVVTIRR